MFVRCLKRLQAIPKVSTDVMDGREGVEGNALKELKRSIFTIVDKRIKKYKWAKIRKRRNQKKTPTPKTKVGKKQTNNQVLIP